MLNEIKITSQLGSQIENINTSTEELDRIEEKLKRYVEGYFNILQLKMKLYNKIQERRNTNL